MLKKKNLCLKYHRKSKKTCTPKYLHFGSLRLSLTGLLLFVYGLWSAKKTALIIPILLSKTEKKDITLMFKFFLIVPDRRASRAFISSIRPPLPPLVRLASFLAPELSSDCKQTEQSQRIHHHVRIHSTSTMLHAHRFQKSQASFKIIDLTPAPISNVIRNH